MFFVLIAAFACAAEPLEIFNGTHFVDGWSIINTAGTSIVTKKDENNNTYLSCSLRTWDTVRAERTAVLETDGYKFLSYIVEYSDNTVRKMRFRTRLFSEPYNQQTETELRVFDYLFKEGDETRIFIPLSNAQTEGELQTFTIQRIETTDKKLEFKIKRIELVTEGIPTGNDDIESVTNSESTSSNDPDDKKDNGVLPFVVLSALLFLAALL